MNKNIYEAPLILFLGAGASKPLGLRTTPEFWRWFRITSGFDYRFLDAIAESVEPSKEIGKQPDIEGVLDVLGKIIEGWWLENEVSNRLNLNAFGLKADYFNIRENIKDTVIKHYSEIETGAFELYRPLLELAGFHPLPVFTTNYDLAVEKAYELSSFPPTLIDGFDRTKVIPEWSRSAYEVYRPRPAEKVQHVLFFKLHGSVDWVRTPSGAIQRVESRKRDPGGMKTEIAYPSRLKSEIHEEPHRTNYDYLIACLLYAKVCAVIGFSFRDQEIVEEFRQAMGLNKELKLLVIDPDAEVIKSELEKEDKLGSEASIEAIPIPYNFDTNVEIADLIYVRLYRPKVRKANKGNKKAE